MQQPRNRSESASSTVSTSQPVGSTVTMADASNTALAPVEKLVLKAAETLWTETRAGSMFATLGTSGLAATSRPPLKSPAALNLQ